MPAPKVGCPATPCRGGERRGAIGRSIRLLQPGGVEWVVGKGGDLCPPFRVSLVAVALLAVFRRQRLTPIRLPRLTQSGDEIPNQTNTMTAPKRGQRWKPMPHHRFTICTDAYVDKANRRSARHPQVVAPGCTKTHREPRLNAGVRINWPPRADGSWHYSARSPGWPDLPARYLRRSRPSCPPGTC
jgi:hypothetical protein